MKKATPNEMESRSSTLNYITSNDKTSRYLADKNELEIFFRVLFKNANAGYFSLRGFKSDNALAFKPESYLFNDRQLLASADRLANLTARLPKAVFCTPISTFKVSDKATEEVIANGIAITVDFDDVDPQKSKDLLEGILGPATLVIASGGQWQDNQTGDLKQKLHMHWRLTNPTTKQEDHERLKRVRKLAAQISSADLSASSLVHPMRVPGSWHTKAEPKMCYILECREDVEISLEVAEAALGLKFSSKPTSLSDKRGNNSRNRDYGLAALENESLELSQALKGSRNTRLNKAAFCLGQLIAGGELDQSIVFSRLLSVNPKGKTKGTRNKATLVAEQLLQGELETICRRLLQEAVEGNMQAIKMVLDRLLPPKKEHSITIDLPKLRNTSDALQAISSITEAIGNGDITPSEGETLAKIIDINVRAMEVYDFENRLSILEDRAKQ